MGYPSKGRKPIERASKIAHSEVIKNPDVQAYIERCVLPGAPDPASLEALLSNLPEGVPGEVTVVIAIDGGYTETFIREEYPSACITFFTFGPLLFQLADLRALDKKRFISPDDLHRLKQIERYTLVLPTKGVRLDDEASLAATIRRTIYDFFDRKRAPDDDQLIKSLRWFLFRGWREDGRQAAPVTVEHCPNGCGHGEIAFVNSGPSVLRCPTCQKQVFLTDVFRLHERVDEELGAGGIAAYVMTMLEQLVLVHLVHNILSLKPNLLRSILFIKDGPLAFFGLVAPLYRPMRDLVEHLLGEPGGAEGPTIRLVGLEKSGAFVEHAQAIQSQMRPGSFLPVGDEYIRKYIVPGGTSGTAYGHNTYYGQKVLFRAPEGEMYVATIPARTYTSAPTVAELPHVQDILQLLAELRCNMYDNALVPVALANKLVSLSHFPSQRILTTFARQVARK